MLRDGSVGAKRPLGCRRLWAESKVRVGVISGLIASHNRSLDSGDSDGGRYKDYLFLEEWCGGPHSLQFSFSDGVHRPWVDQLLEARSRILYNRSMSNSSVWKQVMRRQNGGDSFHALRVRD
jgi:hypothetical protein